MTYCVLFVIVPVVLCDSRFISEPSRSLEAPYQTSNEGYFYPKPTTTTEPPDVGYSYDRPKGSKHLFFYGPPSEPSTTRQPDIQFDPIYIPPVDPIYLPPYYPPPLQFDPPSDSYLPPPIQNDPPNGIYLPPVQNDPPTGGYLPPVQNDPIDDVVTIEVPDIPSNTYLPPNHKSNSRLRIQVFNMSCMNTPKTKYFKTVLRMSKSSTPTVVNQNLDEVPHCISPYGNNIFYMNMLGSDQMRKCGIRECGNRDHNYLCMNVRFPVVPGLKLPEDVLLTLQCRAHEKFVTQVKFLSMEAPREIQGRSVKSAVATGGQQVKFTGNAVLLRRNTVTGDFTVPVRSDKPVFLGEELLLRTQIKDSDGWKYSRIGRVTMEASNEVEDQQPDIVIDSLVPSSSQQVVKKRKHRKPTDPKKRHFVEILTDGGCRNVHLSGIMPADQLRDPTNPLMSDLPLRAFSFEGLKPGEQMTVTIHMLACVEEEDCKTNCLEDKGRVRRRKRRESPHDDEKQLIPKSNVTKVKKDYQTELKFTLSMPVEEGAMPMLKYEYTRYPAPNALIRSIPHILIVFILVVFMLIFVLFSKGHVR